LEVAKGQFSEEEGRKECREADTRKQQEHPTFQKGVCGCERKASLVTWHTVMR
jgi:hypothetical protein